MPTGPMSEVVRRLRSAAVLHGTGLTDGQLLNAFLSRRDEAALEALVRRHAPMVLGLCRRVVGNLHDAEDAFQATFLVLLRKADSIGSPELLGNWLYGVAYRIALKARTGNARRRARERPVDEGLPAAEPPEDRSELTALLDRELSRLPDLYRVPVVLCELQGQSRKDAARRLGVPEGTLSSRLAAARKMLARRLGRHGLALSAATLLTAAAPASVPAALVLDTVKAALAAAAGTVPAALACLTEGVLPAMLLTRLKIATVLVLALGILGSGALFVRTAPAAAEPSAALAQKEKKEQAPSVRGTVRSLDTGKNTITVAVQADAKSKKTEERTYPVATDATITLEDHLSKQEKPPAGRLADLTAGTGVTLRLSTDGKSVVAVSARGPGLHGHIKAVDRDKNIITVSTKGEDGPVEMTLTLAKGARIIKDDGLGKKGDARKEGSLADLTEGTGVVLQLSVDRKKALGVQIQGGRLQGELKGYDSGTRTLTVTVKEDAQVVDKTLNLAKDGRTEGDLVPGARVVVTLSVHDKSVAAAVRVLKDE